MLRLRDKGARREDDVQVLFAFFSLLFLVVLFCFVCLLFFFSINAPQSHFSSEDDSFEGCFEVYRSFYFHLNDFPRILTRVKVVWI